MRHVLQFERPLESKELTVGGLDWSKDLNTLAIPIQLPAENGRHNNDNKSVRDIRDTGVSGLESVFEFTKRSVNVI